MMCCAAGSPVKPNGTSTEKNPELLLQKANKVQEVFIHLKGKPCWKTHMGVYVCVSVVSGR